MDNHLDLEDRMNEIRLHTEQIAERKTYESEIDSLEEKLKNLESNYERLQTTYKSNLDHLAMMQVDLIVAKEMHTFAQDTLNEKRQLVVLEKQKLDDLHLKIWDEEGKACDEMDKCISENDSVHFLNNYSPFSETQKYDFGNQREFDISDKKAVSENPEVKRLTADVTALETEIKSIEENCSSDELREVLTEEAKLDNDHIYETDETQRLIEALERSYQERMALEDEIREIENCKPEVIETGFTSAQKVWQQTAEKSFNVTKEAEHYNCLVANPLYEEKLVKNTIPRGGTYGSRVSDKEQDKKLKAKKWYEEYARGVAAFDEGIDLNVNLNDFCTAVSQPALIGNNENCEKLFSSQKQTIFERENEYKGAERQGFKLPSTSGRKRSRTQGRTSNPKMQLPKPVESRFFKNEIKYPQKVESEFYLAPKNELLKVDEENSDEMFERENGYEGAERQDFKLPSTRVQKRRSSQGETGNSKMPLTTLSESRFFKNEIPKPATTKSAKFIPKRPSNLGKLSRYRQKKLDDFLKFMLPDN